MKKLNYPARDCTNCKNCVWRKSHYENGIINTCKCDDKIAKLSMDEMLYHINTNTCRFYVAGESTYELDTECYDD